MKTVINADTGLILSGEARNDVLSKAADGVEEWWDDGRLVRIVHRDEELIRVRVYPRVIDQYDEAVRDPEAVVTVVMLETPARSVRVGRWEYTIDSIADGGGYFVTRKEKRDG